MFFALKIIAFMAFIITFSSYHSDVLEFNQFMYEEAFIANYYRLISTIYSQPQQLQAESIFASDNRPLGETATVTLSSGSQIRGQKSTKTTAFYNIRYAQPPLNDLRFADPVLYDQPSFVDGTVQRRISCSQVCNPPLCNPDGITEDCLYLNINVPSGHTFDGSNNELLPVMFWIHGGGFELGSGNDELYDAENLSNSTNTIIVNINYRLGWLGFLPYEKEGITGNQGLKDQRMALKWVYDNIGAFGGDNDQITIFGESAGGQSVMFHLLSEESAPYYQRAIMQSTFAYPYQSSEEWNTIADLLLMQFKLRFKCHMLSGLDCLRQLPHEEFLALNNGSSNIAQALYGARSQFTPLSTASELYIFLERSTPLIDGKEYKSNPLELFKTGQWNTDKDVIIGHTNGEMNLFNNLDYEFTKEMIEVSAQTVFGEYLGSAVVSAYEELQPDTEYNAMFGNLMTNGFYTCHSRAIAKSMANTGSGNIYFYEFAQPYQTRDPVTGELIIPKALHAAELSLLFRNGNPGVEAYKGTEGDKQVMEMLSDYWGSFARDGYPHSDTYASWPVYMAQYGGVLKTLRISQPNSTVVNNLNEDACNFWDVSGYWDNS